MTCASGGRTSSQRRAGHEHEAALHPASPPLSLSAVLDDPISFHKLAGHGVVRPPCPMRRGEGFFCRALQKLLF